MKNNKMMRFLLWGTVLGLKDIVSLPKLTMTSEPLNRHNRYSDELNKKDLMKSLKNLPNFESPMDEIKLRKSLLDMDQDDVTRNMVKLFGLAPDDISAAPLKYLTMQLEQDEKNLQKAINELKSNKKLSDADKEKLEILKEVQKEYKKVIIPYFENLKDSNIYYDANNVNKRKFMGLVATELEFKRLMQNDLQDKIDALEDLKEIRRKAKPNMSDDQLLMADEKELLVKLKDTYKINEDLIAKNEKQLFSSRLDYFGTLVAQGIGVIVSLWLFKWIVKKGYLNTYFAVTLSLSESYIMNFIAIMKNYFNDTEILFEKMAEPEKTPALKEAMTRIRLLINGVDDAVGSLKVGNHGWMKRWEIKFHVYKQVEKALGEIQSTLGLLMKKRA